MGLLHPTRHSVETVMHVVACSAVDPHDVRGPCTISYLIQMGSSEPIEGRRIFDVASSQWPHPGQDLPVTVDSHRPSRITIHWERVDAVIDLAGYERRNKRSRTRAIT